MIRPAAWSNFGHGGVENLSLALDHGQAIAVVGGMEIFFDNLDDIENERMAKLNQQIDRLYGHLAPDEVEIDAAAYPRSTRRLFEVTKIGPRSSVLTDLFENIEYKPVRLPKELYPFLCEKDVLLGTIGFKSGTWWVIHLNPCYTMVEFDETSVDL